MSAAAEAQLEHCPFLRPLCQSVHDHRPGHRCGWPRYQGRQPLLEPREHAPVCLLGSRIIVEDADRCYGVIGRVDYIVGLEAFDITDDRNGALLDPERQLFGHASFCLALTYSSVHGSLLDRRFLRSKARCQLSTRIVVVDPSAWPAILDYPGPRLVEGIADMMRPCPINI